VCYFGGCVPLAETCVTPDSSCVLLQWMCSTGSDCVSLDSSCVLLGSSCDLLDDIVVVMCY
jgi:hypothetical protein